MIGQERVLTQVHSWVSQKTLPRFLIIAGNRGSGKTMLARLIARKMEAYRIDCELGVDAVREAVENCYKCSGTTVYTFINADKMSAQAKNALLKITEEPPRQAYFILTLQNPEATLETLRSRGTLITMEPYTEEQLRQYRPDKTNDTIIQIAQTPGDIDYLLMLPSIDDFMIFCKKVLDNIGIVSGVNAFKIGNNVKFKEGDKGYDAVIFMRAIMSLIKEQAAHATNVSELRMYYGIVLATSDCINQLNLMGVRKDSTFDMWVLKVRGIIKEVQNE